MKIMADEVTYEDFAKLDIRIGQVIAAEMIPETDKLIKCTVDFGLKPSMSVEGPAFSGANDLGERDIRIIVSGIAQWKSPEELIGKLLPYIVNLAPRQLRGVTSEGMLLAASDEDGVALFSPERAILPGTRIK